MDAGPMVAPRVDTTAETEETMKRCGVLLAKER
jgi:hypothetical protein